MCIRDSPDGLPQPSMGWVAPGPDPSETAAAGSGGTGTARWVNDSAAFNGNVSARLDGAGAALANRGLQLAGLALEAGRDYEGYLYARLPAAGARGGASGGDGAPPGLLAAVDVPLDALGAGWTRVPFALTPVNGTRCYAYPNGTAPLDCGSGDAEGDDCRICGGALALSLVAGETGGDDLAVDLDFVYLLSLIHI